MKTENITILDREYKVKIGFGVMMAFEDEMNKDITDIKSKNDIIKLAYITLKYNNKDWNYSYQYFIDEILDNDVQLFIQIIQLITNLLFESDKNVESKKK